MRGVVRECKGDWGSREMWGEKWERRGREGVEEVEGRMCVCVCVCVCE